MTTKKEKVLHILGDKPSQRMLLLQSTKHCQGAEAQGTQAIESKTWIISAAKTKKNPVSSLLAFVHSLVTIFPTLALGISLPAYCMIHHHLNDNHQHQIALLASSVSIELVSSSARVTSAKFHKGVIETPGPIDRTPETPGSGKNGLKAAFYLPRFRFHTPRKTLNSIEKARKASTSSAMKSVVRR